MSAFTSLMVLFALVVPFAGTALANHVSGISLTPETDTAPANTCNAFTVTLTGPQATGDNNPGVPGETIDVIVTDTDTDNTATTTTNEGQSNIVFCTPPATQVGTSDEFGPNPRPNAGNETTFGTTGAQGTGQSRAQTEFCCTDQNGQLTFGIQSPEAGTFSVTAFFDQRAAGATEGDDNPTGDFTDTSTKTFGAPPGTGNEGVRNLDCTPETDQNPEGTVHTFNCVATDANGILVSGATVTADVTAGPNAEEIGPTAGVGGTSTITCNRSSTDANGNTTVDFTSTTTGNNGQVTCRYQDTETSNDNNANTANTSPPGTDTIVAFVQQTPPAGTNGTPGADAFEPQDTITKSFVGDANNIDCEDDEGGTATAGAIITITCTVTDEVGQPVPNVDVDFTESGAGVFRNFQANFGQCTTAADGTCSVQVETDESEAGEDVVVTATITGDSGNQPDGNGFTGDTNCTTTGGADAGTTADCTDTVTVALEADTPPPPPPAAQCEDGVDNDGDGRIDFPNDTGCANGDDPTENTEGSGPGDPEEIRRARTLRITELKHVRLPGKDKPALLVKGRVSAENFAECAAEVPIKVQIRAGGEFITRKTDTTNANGVFKVLIRDVQAKYRAVATKFQIEDTDANQINICLKAKDVRRHNH